MARLYYVAPFESMESILKHGILPPIEVNRLIEEGKLPEEVLGISYKGYDTSHFPEFVSLLRNEDLTKMVAQSICFSRTQRDFDPNFRAIGYIISPEIEKLPEFVAEKRVKMMNDLCYPGEVLFRGRIEPRFIGEHPFNVRTM
ncbi:MAG: hypothetical protein WCK29_04170 [archaeon]